MILIMSLGTVLADVTAVVHVISLTEGQQMSAGNADEIFVQVFKCQWRRNRVWTETFRY